MGSVLNPRATPPHQITWRHAADLAIQIHRTASRGVAVRVGLAKPLQQASLRVPAALTLASLEREIAAGRRHLVTALRALAVLDSHLRIAIELLPSERPHLRRHVRAGNLLYRLIVSLAVRSVPALRTGLRDVAP